jgi:uncharacterized protein (UPF0548 family)
LLIGLTPRADSTYEDTFRVSETGALVVTDGRSRFSEPTTRNQVFSVTTALAGTTVVAANVAPPAAGAATVLSILNPLGSGVNLAIVQGYVRTISATTGGAGAWAWCGAIANTAITAAEATALKRAAVVGQGVAAFKAWSQAALTGGPVHKLVRPFPLARVAAAAAATSWSLDAVDNVDGALVVGPGGLLTLAPAAVGTSVVVGAGVVLIQTALPEV